MKAVFGRFEFLSSDEQYRIPTFLFMDEGITLAVLFHGPRLVLCRPLTLRAQQDFTRVREEGGSG